MSAHVPFPPTRLLLRAPAAPLDQLLGQLCDQVHTAPGLPEGLSPDELRALLPERLDAAETIAQHGIFVSLRLHNVAGIRLAFATLARPVPHPALAEGLRWVALVVSPRERPVQELRVLEQLRQLGADPAWRRWIDEAEDPVGLAAWLDARLREEDGTLTARDLMRPSMGRTGPDTPIPALVKKMAAHGLEAVGVTDDQRRVIGQITAQDLFTFGMPDFFHQLKSVSFIPDFDPFEAYFAREGNLVARDVMGSSFCTLPPDATLLEVVFALTVQGHPKVYVVEDDALIGVIDRIRVLDRILSP